jgi:hypothetical protein
MVEERFAKMDSEEYGEEWHDKSVYQTVILVSGISLIIIIDLQNDMLMWLMSDAKGVVC